MMSASGGGDSGGLSALAAMVADPAATAARIAELQEATRNFETMRDTAEALSREADSKSQAVLVASRDLEELRSSLDLREAKLQAEVASHERMVSDFHSDVAKEMSRVKAENAALARREEQASAIEDRANRRQASVSSELAARRAELQDQASALAKRESEVSDREERLSSTTAALKSYLQGL